MELPESAQRFVESVKDDALNLIRRGIWDIPLSRFESWFKQFREGEDQFFAACLVDQIIYRTNQQFEACMKSLFRSNLLGKIFPGEHDLFLYEKLISCMEPRLRLVPVIKESDPPTKSGPLVLRRLQRILKLNPKWMIWPWQVKDLVKDKKIDHVIFVDDFAGSGRQFRSFFTQWNFSRFSGSLKMIYAPIVGHESGIENIKEKIPDLEIVTAETLGEINGFFSDQVWRRLWKEKVKAEDAKLWYEKFMNDNKIIRDMEKKFGEGDLALTLSFNHATPNNCLPILWADISEEWSSLLER